MTSNNLLRRFVHALGAFGSARRAARAVEIGRSPAPSDLERLGISAIAFGAINKN